jgi:hypothetical protein
MSPTLNENDGEVVWFEFAGRSFSLSLPACPGPLDHAVRVIW